MVVRAEMRCRWMGSWLLWRYFPAFVWEEQR